jgi:hypothetical protein
VEKKAKGKKEKVKKPLTAIDALKDNNEKSGSATSSSATLDADSVEEAKPKDTLVVAAEETTDNVTKHLPATKENVKKLKKEQVPFSRIPADQKVDPRFASNEYVSYDYADRAYSDLIVTKGKGFTKEKNKKKRGMSPTSVPAPAPKLSRKPMNPVR